VRFEFHIKIIKHEQDVILVGLRLVSVQTNSRCVCCYFRNLWW